MSSQLPLGSTHQLIVEQNDIDQFKRLDQFLSHHLEDLSRTHIKSLFEKGCISSTNYPQLELKKIPPLGSHIDVFVPAPKEAKAKAQNIPLEILFEDSHLIIINKPAGLVVHPAPGHCDGTLVNAILHHCDDLTGVGDEKRPGIVHRLDKGTSGIMVVAKTQACHEKLVELFSVHDITRQYHALVLKRELPVGGTLKSTIGRHPQHRQKMEANVKNGKEAITHYRVLKQFPYIALVEFTLETGRTHQIRVHASKLLNAPILNDPLYSTPSKHQGILPQKALELIKNYEHPFLHAKVLGFVHPITGEKLSFSSDYPQIFKDLIKALDV